MVKSRDTCRLNFTARRMLNTVLATTFQSIGLSVRNTPVFCQNYHCRGAISGGSAVARATPTVTEGRQCPSNLVHCFKAVRCVGSVFTSLHDYIIVIMLFCSTNILCPILMDKLMSKLHYSSASTEIS